MGQRVILYRCDAGPLPEVGTGHLVRGLLLAEQLRESLSARFVFAVGGDPAMRDRVVARGFDAVWVEGSDRDAEGTCAAIARFRPHLVVIDRLAVGRRYLEAVKAEGVLVALVDNPVQDAEPADIHINPVIDADLAVHGGADYAVFRPVRSERRAMAPVGRRVYVSFGGYDHAGLLVPCLRELESLRAPPVVDVVAGGAHPERAELEKIAASSEGRVRLHFDVADVRPLLREADLAVVAGGLTMFECVAHGVPTVVVAQYDHQAMSGSRLAAVGAAVTLGLGASVGPGVVGETVERLLASPAERLRLSTGGRAAVDGQGLLRTAELLSVVRPLPWDSEFFGFRVGRVTSYTVTEDVLTYADCWAREEGIRCLYYLADFTEAKSVRLAEAHGYGLVDVRVMLSRPVPAAGGNDGGAPVRVSRDEDLPGLRALAATMFQDSRFFFDGGFPRERCRELYARWVERLHRESAGRVFVAEVGGEIAGFIACDRVGASRGVIGLIGVDHRFHGHGVGTALVDRALQWFGEEDLPVAQVVTQARNLGALRLYEKSGFRVASTHLWYHKWFSA